MSSFNAKILLAQIEEEELAFKTKHHYPPRVTELSSELQAQINEHILAEVTDEGLDSLKKYLELF
jgi:hypothetical protein